MTEDATRGLTWFRIDALTEACDVGDGRIFLGVSGKSATCNFEPARGGHFARPVEGDPVALPGSHFVGAPPAMRFENVEQAKSLLAHASRVIAIGEPSRLLTASGFSNVAWGREGDERSETWLRRRGRSRQEINVSPSFLTLDEHVSDAGRRNVLTFDLDRTTWGGKPVANAWPRFLARQAALVMLAIRLADQRLQEETSMAA